MLDKRMKYLIKSSVEKEEDSLIIFERLFLDKDTLGFMCHLQYLEVKCEATRKVTEKDKEVLNYFVITRLKNEISECKRCEESLL